MISIKIISIVISQNEIQEKWPNYFHIFFATVVFSLTEVFHERFSKTRKHNEYFFFFLLLKLLLKIFL